MANFHHYRHHYQQSFKLLSIKMLSLSLKMMKKLFWSFVLIFIITIFDNDNGHQFLINFGHTLSFTSSSMSSSSYLLSSATSTTSVHRFSNLYGTIINCKDYLQSITMTMTAVSGSATLAKTSSSSSSSSTASKTSSSKSFYNHHILNHHLLSPSLKIDVIDNKNNLNIESILDYVYQKYLSDNLTFEWQVSNYNFGNNNNNQHQQQQQQAQQHSFEKAIDLLQLRMINTNEGTLSLSPFDTGSFQPDVHDTLYRCLLHLPNNNGIITSREIHVQAVVEQQQQQQHQTSIKSSSSSSSLPVDHHKYQNSLLSSAKQQKQQREQNEQFSFDSNNNNNNINEQIRVINSTEIHEGNDAILKCIFNDNHYNLLYDIVAWFRDDGKIYLPLDMLLKNIRNTITNVNNGGIASAASAVAASTATASSSSFVSSNNIHYVNFSTIRHFVLPNTGDLLISSVTYLDAKHRYRCQIRHRLTNFRQFSPQWAHIIFKKSNVYYNNGPRLNPQLQIRHTIAIDEGESAFFYCSFNGYPTKPSIQWYHTDLKTLSNDNNKNNDDVTDYKSYAVKASTVINNNNNNDNQHYYKHYSDQYFQQKQANKHNNFNDRNQNQYIIGQNFLAIEKVSIDDTGIISCTANDSNSIIRHEMLLFVKNFLQVTLHASTITPFPGDDISLSCNLTALLSSPSSSSSSAFSNNLFNDINNNNNNNNNNEQNYDYQQQIKQEKHFRELISSHFMININWYHNGKLITYDHRKRRSSEELLLIKDFNVPNDNGIYQCSIRLTAPDYDEESFMSAIHINSIEKSPEFIDVFTDQIKHIDNMKRDYLSLKCSTFGIPLPRIRWYLDGQELYSDGHVHIETFSESYNGMLNSSPLKTTLSSATIATSRSMILVSYLNISSLHSKDIGVYECVADNYLSTIKHRARINQFGSPFIKMIANQTAILGRSYTINCTYGGYPLEEVYFVKGKISSSDNNNGISKSSSNNNDNNGRLKRLPFDERHIIPIIGSITITTIEKSDQDYYRCIVVTSNGQKAEQEFYLHVAVAPVISPIVFSDNFEEGKRGSAVCTVTSGDPPIKISWFKDGTLLPESIIKTAINLPTSYGRAQNSHKSHHLNQIQIVPINEFMSSLIIANISRHHQGTYTCMASSPIATSNVSSFLSVKATPQWLLKPINQNAIAGESLTLDCRTTGQPAPVIRWKFLKNEPYRDEPIPILSSQQIHVLENGSLYLRALEPKHSGIYICDASNDISKHTIESRAYVRVNSLPKVSIQNTLGNNIGISSAPSSTSSSTSSIIGKNTNSIYHNGLLHQMNRLILRKGSQTQLMCSVIGIEQPMVAEWLRPNGGEIINDELNEKIKIKNYHDTSRIVIREESKINEKRAYLYISHVQRIDSGIYCCMGINNNGYQVSFIELLIQEPPDMPVNFHAEEINSRSITLNWSISFHGNSPITSYVIEYRSLSSVNTNTNANNNNVHQHPKQSKPDINGIEKKIITAKSLTTTITINSLNPLTTYEFRVCAINDLGASPFSHPLIIKTEMEAPSLIPFDLRTVVLGSRSIKLIWSIVITIEQQQSIEQIDGFYIGYRPVVSSSSSSPSSSQSNIKNNNHILLQQSSGSIIDPSALVMMIGSGGGGSSTNINDNNNNNNNVNIEKITSSGTMIDQSNNNGIGSLDIDQNNNNNNKPIDGIININLNNGKVIPYTFKTMYEDHTKFLSLITNVSNTMINTNSNNIIPKNDNNTVMATFCELISSKSSDLINLKQQQQQQKQWKKLRMDDDNKHLKQIHCVYEFIVNNLKRKTRYGFIIQAFNSKGTGPISQEIYAQTLLKDPPGKPILKLTNVSLYEASFMWSMSKHNNYYYQNYHHNTNNNELLNDFDVIDQQNSINIDGYIISYRALIKRVTFTSSSSNNDEQMFDLKEFMSNDFDINDNSNSDNDNRKYQANNWETITVSDKIQSHTLHNLRCGTLYQIRIEAFNDMGNGEPSDILQFSTLGQAPTVPNSNSFILANITSVMLDLDHWNNGLCPIINFAIRYRIKQTRYLATNIDDNNLRINPMNNNNNNWIIVSSYLKPEYGAMYIIRELLPGTWYELSIIATNDAGETESRYLFSTLTTDGATVEPLYSINGDYVNNNNNHRHLGHIISGLNQVDNIFEDPMILIPATCAIIVLLVIGAATVFIFITRSKEVLTRTEHFCHHRDNSRTADQLSLNLFSKNYSKSDLMHSYNDCSIVGSTVTNNNLDKLMTPHHHIETLNCGQSTVTSATATTTTTATSGTAEPSREMIERTNGGLMMNNLSAQYVEGPTSLTTNAATTSDCDHQSNLPSIIGCNQQNTNNNANNNKQNKPIMESFYSTPCIATTNSSILQQAQQQPTYCTLNKQKANEQKFHQHHLHNEESIIYDCNNKHQQQHPYYTHSQFINQCPEQHVTTTNNHQQINQMKKSDHIYELPKQQLQQQQQQQTNSSNNIEQNDVNLVMLLLQQQQQSSSMDCSQSPHRIRTDQMESTRNYQQQRQNF